MAIAPPGDPKAATLRTQLFPRLLRSKTALASAIILALVIAAALAAPLIAPRDPTSIHVVQRLKPPGFLDSAGIRSLLGTDSLGRDVFSRIVYGARVSLIVGLSAVLISGTFGLLLGLVSGFFGGWIDDVVMRIADIQLSFPTILLALAIMAVLGSGLD